MVVVRSQDFALRSTPSRGRGASGRKSVLVRFCPGHSRNHRRGHRITTSERHLMIGASVPGTGGNQYLLYITAHYSKNGYELYQKDRDQDRFREKVKSPVAALSRGKSAFVYKADIS